MRHHATSKPRAGADWHPAWNLAPIVALAVLAITVAVAGGCRRGEFPREIARQDRQTSATEAPPGASAPGPSAAIKPAALDDPPAEVYAGP